MPTSSDWQKSAPLISENVPQVPLAAVVVEYDARRACGRSSHSSATRATLSPGAHKASGVAAPGRLSGRLLILVPRDHLEKFDLLRKLVPSVPRGYAAPLEWPLAASPRRESRTPAACFLPPSDRSCYARLC